MLFDKYRALRRSYTITQIHSDCDPMRGSEKGGGAIVSMSNHGDCDNRNALSKPDGTAWSDDPQKDTMILSPSHSPSVIKPSQAMGATRHQHGGSASLTEKHGWLAL